MRKVSATGRPRETLCPQLLEELRFQGLLPSPDAPRRAGLQGERVAQSLHQVEAVCCRLHPHRGLAARQRRASSRRPKTTKKSGPLRGPRSGWWVADGRRSALRGAPAREDGEVHLRHVEDLAGLGPSGLWLLRSGSQGAKTGRRGRRRGGAGGRGRRASDLAPSCVGKGAFGLPLGGRRLWASSVRAVHTLSCRGRGH